MKHELEHLNLTLTFHRREVLILDKIVYGLRGLEDNAHFSGHYYLLDGDRRVYPAHFKYGLAAISHKVESLIQDFLLGKMLREYLPVELIREELVRGNWFWDKIAKEESWSGSYVPIPLIIDK